MKAKRIAAFIAAGIGLVASLLVPSAASAAPPSTAAASGDPFIIWLDPNFQGPAASMDNHLPAYGNLVYAGTSIPISNSASSAANYAPDFVLMAFRDELPACDHTAPLLLFLRKGDVTANESWFYADLDAKFFDNDISGHCFRG